VQIGEADAAEYRVIRLRALRTSPDAFGAVHDVAAARPIESHIERLSTSRAFGAFSDGDIIGLAGFKQEAGPKDAHKGFVWGVFVEPGMRGRGTGAALMRALLDDAAGIVEQLTLAVVTDHHAAIALYTKFGFIPYGTEPRALKANGVY